MRQGASLTGWGGMGVDGTVRHGENLEALSEGAMLTRGLGRSYGDASIPPCDGDEIISSARADALLRFDEATGVLRAQSGFSLRQLKELFLPRGWYTPVSPGTQFVTLGGMVASDVHGKNHHVSGTLGRHVVALKMRTGTGEVLEVTREQHPDLFAATLGGMGLTGHILEVELKLEKVPSAKIWSTKRQVANIHELLEGLYAAADAWPMTVSWIDCLATGASLGRGYLWEGRWATAAEAGPPQPKRKGLHPNVPMQMPGWLMNRWSIKAVNEAIFRSRTWPSAGVEAPESFFYPLDAIHNWNRLYGTRGFAQHQAIIPREAGVEAVVRYVELIARLGGASPLCVLKDCGPEGEGVLSFPKPGTSVALDLPMTPHMAELTAQLNRFVLDHGGRIYLTKDAFTTREHFEAMEGERLTRFQEIRRAYDPDLNLRSAMSVRLFGDAPEGK